MRHESEIVSGSQWKGVLVILADGARPDVMERMAQAGELPVFKAHFVDRGGFRQATGVFPSVSGPAHLPVLCGVHPGRANLPGIRWMERPAPGRRAIWGHTRSYMAPFRARKLERDVPADVKTLFQHLPGTADVNTWFVRGCRGKARRTRFSKAAAFVRSFVSADWYSSDLQAERAVRGAFEAGFTSVSAVFPAVDELGHRCGPLSEESFESYRRFDASLGRLFDVLTRLGRAEDTLVLLTSDHGQTTTHTHVDLDDLVREIYPRTVAYPRFWGHAFSAEAAVMVSGNSMANVYLRGPGGWHEPPDVEAAGSRPAELVARLLAHEAIRQVIYRRQGAPESRCYVIADANGRLVIEAPDGPEPVGKDAPLRLLVEGENPLGGSAEPRTVTARQLGAEAADAAFPDAVWQVVEFFRSPRAGDLVVCATAGFDLRSRFEYQPHRGSHGCLDREHMLVPAAVNARWDGGPLRSVDLFPSVLAALGRAVPTGLDGEAVRIVAD